MQMFATKKTNSILLMENLTFKWIKNSFQTECNGEMLLQIPGREPVRGYYESQFSAAAQVAHCCAIFLCYLGGEIFHLVGQLLPPRYSQIHLV